MTVIGRTAAGPSESITVPPFAVISGGQVQRTLQGRGPDRGPGRGHLPAAQRRRFPENVAVGIPRASAVLILNDHDTGYPFACLESSIISTTRTAALAASAADWLSRGRRRPTRIGFFGAGLIARYIHTFLAGTGWSFDEIGVHDLSADGAAGFHGYLAQSGTAGRITVHERAEQLIRSSDLVVFATVAGRPHVSDPSWFAQAAAARRVLRGRGGARGGGGRRPDVSSPGQTRVPVRRLHRHGDQRRDGLVGCTTCTARTCSAPPSRPPTPGRPDPVIRASCTTAPRSGRCGTADLDHGPGSRPRRPPLEHERALTFGSSGFSQRGREWPP